MLAAILLCCLAPLAAPTEADLFGALTKARRAAAEAPDDPAPVLAIAELQIRLGAPAEALDALARLRHLAPDDPRGYLLAALVLRDVERVDEATTLLRSAIGRGLDEPDLAESLGLLLLSEGDASGADTIARRALESHPDDGGLLLVRGLALAADPARRDQAAAWLDRALANDAPDPGRVHLELGTLRAEADGGCEAALDHFRKARELLGDSSEVLFRLGSGLARCGQADEGRAILERSQALRRNAERRDHGARSTGAALNAVQELAADGQIEAALSRLDDLAAESPADDRIVLLRARLRFASGKPAAALADVERAQTIRPGRVEAHYLEGLFASQTGDMDRATIALGRALALDAGHAPSLGLAAAISADGGNLDRAADLFRRAFLHGAEGAALRLAYARVLDALDRGDEAERQRELAATFEP